MPCGYGLRDGTWRTPCLMLLACWLTAESLCALAGAQPSHAIDFNRDIRPLLAENCLQCHGPDAQARAADLRLDIESAAKSAVIRPGAASESEFLHRIESNDPDSVMPPPATGKTLTPAQKELLRRWIDGGANYAKHWALEPIMDAATCLQRLSPEIPTDLAPIDRFLKQRLHAVGLDFAPEISRVQFLRRATFDLTGLPPTWSEVEAFLNDNAPGNLERVIDRLLESPRYGERWGRHWLDIARYADTHGGAAIGFTSFPFSYTYRDYVIGALQRDLPFDRFILEQLAADQLGLSEHDPALAALGFLTVGMQFRNDHDTIDDRIDVVTRGLMGLTVTCARCHDHKFDAIPTTDYYAIYAAIAPSRSPSTLPIIGEVADEAARAQYQRDLQSLTTKLQQFVRDQTDVLRNRLRMQVGLYLKEIAKGVTEQDTSTQFLSYRTDDIRPIVFNRWVKFLDALPKDDPVFGPWLEMKSWGALPPEEFAAKRDAALARWNEELGPNARAPEQLHALRAEPPRWNPILLDAIANAKPNSLSDLANVYGTVFAETQKQWLTAVLEATLEATSETTVVPDDHPQHQTINSPSLRQLRHYLYAPGMPLDIPDEEAARLTNRTISDLINGKRGAIHQLNLSAAGSPPRAMVLREDPSPRETFVFLRGNPLTRGERVEPRFLTALSGPQMPAYEDGQRRLGLARSIVAPDNPLTRRVLVNWVWQNHFGVGLVRTPDDFGTRGQPPTHPELLDFLADEFRQHGWSLKWLHKQIMLSRAYRQSAIENDSARQIDPENATLWRMPRRRLDFESMRDAMLAVSEELDLTMGGRPVDLSAAPAVPRRSVYGFINRDIIANLMSTFDAANPNACTAKRPETMVPQQTLFALNSEFIQDRAAKLALLVQQSHSTDDDRIAGLFRRVLSREPAPSEIDLAKRYLAASSVEPPATEPAPAAPTAGAPTAGATHPSEPAWVHLAHALLASNEFIFLD